MQISDAGVRFITNEEGVVLHPYKDSIGVPTIGIGTTVYPNGQRVSLNDPPITIEKAEEYLKYYVSENAIPALARYVTVVLSQNQVDALCSFIYNVGSVAFANSRLLAKINESASCDDIRTQFMRWNKAGGKVSTGLTARRNREANLYCQQ